MYVSFCHVIKIYYNTYKIDRIQYISIKAKGPSTFDFRIFEQVSGYLSSIGYHLIASSMTIL